MSLKKLIEANQSVDSGDKWNNNHWHFNRNIGEDVAAAKKAYADILKQNWKDMLDAIASPSVENCQKALQSVGWLSHAWQDYYAHAIDMDSDGMKNVGSITGTPDNPGSNMKPSSWDSAAPFKSGEHGGVAVGYKDPAYRAPDTDARRRLSAYVTSIKFDFFLEKWWPACKCEACKK